jgi:hypothetical protein
MKRPVIQDDIPGFLVNEKDFVALGPGGENDRLSSMLEQATGMVLGVSLRIPSSSPWIDVGVVHQKPQK